MSGRIARSLFGAPSFAMAMLLLTAVALGTRIPWHNEFVTVDEGIYWIDRTQRFIDALQSQNYAATLLTGHPGVTTLWIGTFGTLAFEQLTAAGWLADNAVSLLNMQRLLVALVSGFCIRLAVPLLQRLFGNAVAWLAAFFWAGNLFLSAHSQLLHLDALLASFMTLAVLAAMVAFQERSNSPLVSPEENYASPFLYGSAAAAGLAFLTKGPAIALLPFIALLTLVSIRQSSIAMKEQNQRVDWTAILLRSNVILALWSAIALATWVMLWPAVWVDPLGAIRRVVGEILGNGLQPHDIGNFFLGRAVADPGPLFYPTVLVLRSEPWLLIGLLLLPLTVAGRHMPAQQRNTMSMLIVYVLLFMLMMSLAAKKFDRYLLPLFPVLAILAAIGWVALFRGAMQQVMQRLPKTWLLIVQILVLSLIALRLLFNANSNQPYLLSYYNPLFGGGEVASETIPVGWGEAMEQAAAYVVAQPDGCEREVAVWFEELMGPYTCPRVVPLDAVLSPEHDVGYVIIYIDQLQRRYHPEVLDRLVGKAEPVHTVEVNGIPYAAVYHLPQPIAQSTRAGFGSTIELRGYDIDTTKVRDQGVLGVTVQWYSRAPAAEAYQLFLHIVDQQGRHVAKVDVPPAGPQQAVTDWQTHHYYTYTFDVPLDPNIAAESYWLSLGLYHPQNQQRLPLHNVQPDPAAPEDGRHALLLGPFAIE